MKRLIALLLCMVFVLSMFAACNSTDEPADDNPPTENPPVENPPEEDIDPSVPNDYPIPLKGVAPIRYTSLRISGSYTIAGGDKLSRYNEQTLDKFYGVCRYFFDNSYELYGYNILGGVYAATFVNADTMYHIYFVEPYGELNIVNSKTAPDALPPVTPAVVEGEAHTAVAQLEAVENNPNTEINGMGYVVRLADGSFMCWDGGYETRLEEMWNTLVAMNGGSEENIVIRSWLLTHSHGDHYPVFDKFADKYASKVKLDNVLICPPATTDTGSTDYLVAGIAGDVQKFEGAKILYVHTGMVLNYCDIKLEILYTADQLYIAGASDDFNNTSIVSRVVKENGKSVLFLGDAGDDVSTDMVDMYGSFLKSDMCQAAHHGVEDFTVQTYNLIRAATWFYPCNKYLYTLTNRDADVRQAVANYDTTVEILLHDKRYGDRYIRSLIHGKACN